MTSYSWAAPLDPQEIKDYEVSWQPELASKGDSLASSTFSLSAEATAAGLQIDSQSETTYGGVVWLSVDGAKQDDPAWDDYGTELEVLHTITTTAGRTYQRSIRLRVKQL